jgi:hypothetical protein
MIFESTIDRLFRRLNEGSQMRSARLSIRDEILSQTFICFIEIECGDLGEIDDLSNCGSTIKYSVLIQNNPWFSG